MRVAKLFAGAGVSRTSVRYGTSSSGELSTSRAIPSC
jgi:hypothetical protein